MANKRRADANPPYAIAGAHQFYRGREVSEEFRIELLGPPTREADCIRPTAETEYSLSGFGDYGDSLLIHAGIGDYGGGSPVGDHDDSLLIHGKLWPFCPDAGLSPYWNPVR